MSLSKPKTMSRIQKSALRKVHREIARDLVPTNDFIAALREKKIFPDDLITLITDEKTNENKVYKTLELLEKRGYEAFDRFVSVLSENYEWLADRIKMEYEFRQNRCTEEKKSGLHHSLSAPALEDSSEDNVDSTTGRQSHSHSAKIQARSIRDAAVSPIQVINTPRVSCMCQRQNYHRTRTDIRPTETGLSSFPDSQISRDGIPKLDTDENVVHNFSITNSYRDIHSQSHGGGESPELESEESKELVSSEEFYAEARRISARSRQAASRITTFQTNDEDDEDELNNIPNDDSDSHYGLSTTFSSVGPFDHLYQMKALYLSLHKLLRQDDATGESSSDVTWEMLNDVVDELTTALNESDDSKTVQECENLFPLKKPGQTLITCIQNLKSEMESLETKYKSQMEEMAKIQYENQHNTSLQSKLKKTMEERDEIKKCKTELEARCQKLEAENKALETAFQEDEDKIRQLEDEQKKPFHSRRRRTVNLVPTWNTVLRTAQPKPQQSKPPQPKYRSYGSTTTKKPNKPN